jgi:TonB family protein
VVVEFEAAPSRIAASVEGEANSEAGSLPPVAAVEPMAPQSRISPIDLLVLAWWLGALWMLARLIDQQRHFLRRLGPLQRRADGSYLASSTRIGPAVVGALRPRIVLPADFEQRYDERQRALVLAHERCHLRRGDLQVNLLASALRCVFWFNPLVHLAAARLRVDQELACDAAVLRDHPDAGRDYATALLNTQLADLGLPVGCYWQSSQSLKWRIAMLKRPSPGAARLLAGAMLALLASSAAAATLWQAQPMNSVAVPAAAVLTMAPVPAVSLQVAAPTPMRLVKPVVDLPVVTQVPVVTPVPAAIAVIAAAGLDAEADQPATAEEVPQDPAPLTANVDAVVPLSPPRVVSQVHASEPYRSSRRPEGGYVVVMADIAADGRLVSAEVPDGTVTPVYRTQALSAVEQWTFEPARRGDVPVAATVALAVYFGPRRKHPGEPLDPFDRLDDEVRLQPFQSRREPIVN